MNETQGVSNKIPIRVCHLCGCLTPANIPYCLECNALVPEVAEEHKTIRFLQSVFRRRVIYSYIFFTLNIVVFIFMTFAGGSTDPAVLRAFGAKQSELISAGEYWRLVMPIFLHVGIIHLVFNNYALWVMGPQLESLYGSARFVIIYLFSGILGCLASCIFSEGFAAGASGALFGIFSVFAVFAFKYKNEIPEMLYRTIKNRVYPLIGLNLILTLALPQIDKAGHLGGLLGGAIAAFLIPYLKPEEEKTPFIWTALQLLFLVVMSLSFATMIWRYDGPYLSPSALQLDRAFDLTGSAKGPTQLYSDAVNEAERVFSQVKEASISSNIDQNVLKRLKTQNIQAQAVIENAPRLGHGANKLKADLIKLLKEQILLLDSGLIDLKSIEANCNNSQIVIHNWIEQDGKYYGLVESETKSS